MLGLMAACHNFNLAILGSTVETTGENASSFFSEYVQYISRGENQA